jgi:hypothetical protein
MIQQVHPGKWAELEAIDKKYNAIEAKYHFPQKRRLQELMGCGNGDTLIVEYQWDTLANMEATYLQIMADPEYQKLQAAITNILDSTQTELFLVLP